MSSKVSSPAFSVTGTSDQGLFEIKPENFFSISGYGKGKHKVILIGEVEKGIVQTESIITLSNGKNILTARVARIEMNKEQLTEAVPGESVGLQLSGVKIQELRKLNAS